MLLYLTCAAAIALANFVWLLVQSLTGLHGEYLSIGVYTQYANLPILFGGLVLSIRAFQHRFPQRGWNYGSRFSTCIGIAALYACLSIVTTYVYMNIINPGFGASLLTFQLEQLRERQATATEIKAAEAFMQHMLAPLPVALSTFLSTSVIGLLLSTLAPVVFLRKQENLPAYSGATS